MGRRREVDLGSQSLNEAFRDLRADYNASKTSRFRRTRTGVGTTPRGADYHYRSEGDLFRMMETHRDYVRNDMVVGQGVRRLVNNVLQDGITLDIRTPDEGLNADLQSRWNDWAEDRDQCDLQGERVFRDLQKAVLQQVIVDGDAAALPNRDGPIELVEADRMRTPSSTKRNVIHGVELDANRRRIGYWFTKDELDPYATAKASDMRRVDARDKQGWRQVLHTYRPERLTQTRGVSCLAPICDVAGMHDDLQFAQLVAAQVQACFAILEEIPVAMPGGGYPNVGKQSDESLTDGTTRTLAGVSPGMIHRSQPGGKLHGFAPSIPGPQFFPHATLLLTFISINLDLPVAVLLLDPSRTNFSGWRGAIDQARMGFRDIQRWLVDYFCREVYWFKLRQWAAEDPTIRRAYETMGEAFWTHRWNPPRWPYIEPMSDASADLLRMRNLLAPPSVVTGERGYEWKPSIRQGIQDNAFAIREAKATAKEINTEFPEEPVSWREVLTLPTPDKLTTTLTGAAQETPEPAPEPTPQTGDNANAE